MRTKKTVVKHQKNTLVKKQLESCVVCADPIRFYAIGPCNHSGVCSMCAFRMRSLMKDRNCPMCKQNIERVIVAKEFAPYESFETWGDTGGPNVVYDDKSEIFVTCDSRTHFDKLMSLRKHYCPRRSCKFRGSSFQHLNSHLIDVHNLRYCELCVANQHFFIQEQKLYTPKSLKAHENKKSSNNQKKKKKNQQALAFHPTCEFCRKKFYSDVELYTHMERDHFKCHLCPDQYQYYRNYASLESHFRSQHHLCEEPNCLSSRYVVFRNDIDYQGHMSSEHGVNGPRLLFNFQIARPGTDSNPDFLQSLAQEPNDDNQFQGSNSSPTNSASSTWNRVVSDSSNTPALHDSSQFPSLSGNGNSTTTGTSCLVPSNNSNLMVPHSVSVRSTSRNGSQRSRSGQNNRNQNRMDGRVDRNRRLMEAFSLHERDSKFIERELIQPKYTPDLIEWGRGNFDTLLVVERKIDLMLKDPEATSTQLKSMFAEERKMVHELAVYYNLKTQSFDAIPRRYVSIIKQRNSSSPDILLSEVIKPPRRPKFPGGRTANGTGTYRGWEKIPVKETPRDAWSDDEECSDKSNMDESSVWSDVSIEEEAKS